MWLNKFLNDNTKFSKLDTPSGKEINQIIKLEKKSISILQLLKNKKNKNKSTYESKKLLGSRPGIL